ncbi:uncharacterized protein LOC125944773 [Dermacentor silvarum]|uniref:uncharacterized protein LOC125944773 n=1 Tax=Dermacentor silvarum TaxID=543639 RepID=UPI002100AB14|nr:uncharacterized protein LOC125944773 [Dermacentor silvarum]
MQTKACIGILLLLVTERQGTCKMVNLTAEAEEYLNKSVRHGWKTWGLDQNYEYWTHRHQTQYEYPIRGTVDKFQQDNQRRGPKTVVSRVCKERFTWNFESGIWSPFPLLVNVTVHLMKGGRQAFQLDLNNATSIVKQQRLGVKKTKVAIIELKKCHFHAEVTFDGWFAYKVKEVRGDMPDYMSVGIGQLNDLTKGLKSVGHHKLKYNMSGTFKHQLVCTNKIKVGRPQPRTTKKGASKLK